MRTIVDIPEEQLQQLAELCRRDDVSRAEAVRQAIADFLKSQSLGPDVAFGLWRNRGTDGVDYQQAIRDEWSE